MADHGPQYRYRGNVVPCAEVARPVAVRRTVSANSSGTGDTTAAATIDIFDVIDSCGGWWGISAHDVDAALKAAGDVETLYVRLNSPGGEALEGVAIANLLRAHPAAVRVTVYGLAASAASVIATAGDTVSMAPGSMLMIHDASDFAFGNATKMQQAATALAAVSDSYADLYAMKAGGDRASWRDVMRAETWYPAADAVTAKLADVVGLDPQLPANQPPVEEDDAADDDVIVNVDVEINPAARAAARRFDLSLFSHAPAALAASQTPAASADGSTTHEGTAAVAFTDEQLTTMRQQLGVAVDADEATILAALGEALAESADPAASTASPPAAASVPPGSVVVSQDVLDELRIAARAGQEARAVQLRQDRDDTISAAISGGYVSRERREHWTAQWDADPEGAQAALATLTGGEPLFPVGEAPGHGGDAEVTGKYTDEMAAEDAELFGLPKEAFSR